MNSGCFMSLVLTGPPRLALLCVWLFNLREILASGSIITIILELLGFIFLPYTTLFYMMALQVEDRLSIIGLLLMGGGIFLDFVAILVGSYALGPTTRTDE